MSLVKLQEAIKILEEIEDQYQDATKELEEVETKLEEVETKLADVEDERDDLREQLTTALRLLAEGAGISEREIEMVSGSIDPVRAVHRLRGEVIPA